MQSNNRLSFLNVLVNKNEPNPETNTYRQPTHAGLYTKWNNFASRIFIMNSLKCLLDRCCRICSSCKIICDEFEPTETMLSRKSYPKYVLDKNLQEFLNRMFATKPSLSKKNDSTPKKIFIRL